MDLAVTPGGVTGIVGESGSGKTTLGLAILGLLGRERAVVGGEVRFEGDLVGAPGVDRTAPLRGRRIGFIPQDPFRAFDPLRRIGPQIARPLERHLGLDRATALSAAGELLDRLGVPDPPRVLRSHPHELSGGMLQRAVIATALGPGPALIIADEPTTALDVLVRIEVADAFLDVVRDRGTALLVITHDLRLLERMADRLAVMYAGRVVEAGPRARLLEAPRHPYSAALRAASVLLAEPGDRVPTIEGQPPALPGTFPPCAYAPRCPRADERCRTLVPELQPTTEDGAACHHPLDGAGS